MTDIHFGTDGWRARIAEDYTFDNVRRCAQGFASYLLAHGEEGGDVVIGYDKRFAAEHFAAAAAEVMAGNGFRVWLTDTATPTPVISYSITAASRCATSTARPLHRMVSGKSKRSSHLWARSSGCCWMRPKRKGKR